MRELNIAQPQIVEQMSTNNNDKLALRLNFEQGALEDVWQSLCLKLRQSGVESELNTSITPQSASYTLLPDPVDKTETLVGTWRDKQGNKKGEIQIREDGGIFAEIDIICNHPTDKRWFIEAITAWGNTGNIITELKLLPAV